MPTSPKVRTLRNVADQLERTTNLLALLLETREPLTLEAIVDQLGDMYPPTAAARRGAFERDKGLLRDIGVPIETQVLAGERAGQTAYWVDRERYELSGLDLTDAERRALQVAVAMVRSTEGEFGLLKLGGNADTAASVTANLPQLDLLPALREAIASRASVQFHYHGANRSLQPYGLLLREGFWYLIGHDVAHGAIRTYRVDRIDGDITTGEGDGFERPTNFDPRAAFPSDPKEIGESQRVATVRIDVARAALAVRELGEDTIVRHRGDGSVDVEVPCANLDAFRSWLMGWGVHAEVVAPADVRAAIVEWLRTVAADR
jgi:predicted DNA-binding transcriptional regulator YafY